MSRKHFEAIAASLHRARLSFQHEPDAQPVIDHVVECVADALAHACSNFDRQRFIDATSQ